MKIVVCPIHQPLFNNQQHSIHQMILLNHWGPLCVRVSFIPRYVLPGYCCLSTSLGRSLSRYVGRYPRICYESHTQTTYVDPIQLARSSNSSIPISEHARHAQCRQGLSISKVGPRDPPLTNDFI